MNTETFEDIDVGALLGEVRRYLAAVDLFRAEGREPHWLPEPNALDLDAPVAARLDQG